MVATGVSAYLASRGVGGGGGSPMVMARRDSPEIIIPTLAAAGAVSFGTADALGGYGNIQAATAQDWIWIGGWLSHRVGFNTAAGAGGTIPVQRIGRCRWATGAVGAEAKYGEHRLGGALTLVVTNPGAATTVQGIGLHSSYHRLGPKVVAAGTRLAYAGAYNDVGPQLVTRAYAAMIDPAAPWAFVDTGYALADYYAGSIALDATPTDYTTLNIGGVMVLGAYATLPVNGGGVADFDYLAEGFYWWDWAGVIGDAQFDIAVGAAASEVVQARVGAPAQNGFGYVPYYHRFDQPFIVYAGERIAARGAKSGAADTVEVSLNLIRIS